MSERFGDWRNIHHHRRAERGVWEKVFKRLTQAVTGLDGKMTVHYLPGYAPDLNSDELVWSHAKCTGNVRRPLQKGERLADHKAGKSWIKRQS